MGEKILPFNKEILRAIEIIALVLDSPGVYSEYDIAGKFGNISIQTIRRDMERIRNMGISIHSSKKTLKILNNIPDKVFNGLLSIYLSLNKFDTLRNLKLIRKRFGNKTLSLFVKILQAINKKELIKISYINSASYEEKIKILTPVLLTRNGRSLYLLGYESDNSEELRVYLFEKIKYIDFIKIKSSIKKIPDTTEFFKYSWGIYTGGEVENVTLRFHKNMTNVIKNKFFIESQQIIEYDDGCQLEMKVKISEELISWVMGWGDLVEILEPDSLKESVIIKANQIIKLYK